MPNSKNASNFSTYTSLMRVNSAGRPYAKDMFDLFGAALIQLPLTDHRVLFRNYPNTFTTEESIATLADLKFTQIIRTPDPANPGRFIATRTTTTFTMSPTMAKTLGTHILEARLLESVTEPHCRVMKDKGIWRPTPKGKFMIQEFAKRAHVDISGLEESLSRIESFRIFVFERLADDDKLASSRPNMTNAFRMMMAWLPTEKLLADDVGGLREANLTEYKYTFYGYQAFQWICEYTTVVDRKEAEMIAAEFVLYGWISKVIDKSDRANSSKEEDMTFKMTKTTLYYVTERGRKILGWVDEPEQVLNDRASLASSNTASSSEQSELFQRKRRVAKRLVTTEQLTKQTDLPIPSAVITEQIQTGTSSLRSTSSEKSDSSKLFHYGFSNNAPPPLDPTEATTTLDEVTERLLRLQASEKNRRSVERAASLSSKASSSQDSGVEVGGNDEASSVSNTDTLRSGNSVDSRRDDAASPPIDIMGCNNESMSRDSHWARLRQILEDPLIRMYFRDFMRASFCDENINFWMDYYSLRKKCRARATLKELLSDSYGIYDSYLGPNAQYEVNIDHGLRRDIIQLVSSTFSVVSNSRTDMPFSSSSAKAPQMMVVINGQSSTTLKALLRMYDKVNEHICRIMAQDSVPRFIRTQQYRNLIDSGVISEDSEHQQNTKKENVSTTTN